MSGPIYVRGDVAAALLAVNLVVGSANKDRVDAAGSAAFGATTAASPGPAPVSVFLVSWRGFGS